VDGRMGDVRVDLLLMERRFEGICVDLGQINLIHFLEEFL